MIPFILQSISWPFMRFVFGLFVDFKVKGLKNLKGLESKSRGIIFASNHFGELDPIVVTGAVPFFSELRPMYYVSREKEFYNNTVLKRIFYGGFFFRLWGAYPAYPGHHDYAFALPYHLIFLRKGKSVCIFPEGKINKDGTLREAKGGVGYLAEATESVIVPTFISGTKDMTLFKFFFGKGKIKVIFGKPIYPKDLEKGEFKKNAIKVMEVVYNL